MGTESDVSQLVGRTHDWAARPAGSTGDYLSVDPPGDQPTTETLTFGAGPSYLGFLWGSPDEYNSSTVTTNLASYDFTGTLIIDPANSDRLVSRFVNEMAPAGPPVVVGKPRRARGRHRRGTKLD